MTESKHQQLREGPPLPEMVQAELSQQDVLALVADLQAFARVTGTLCKVAPQQQVPPDNILLEAAIDQLIARTVVAVQIRYVYDGHEWTDTLVTSPSGVRLVRCQHANAIT